ncbi:response regulator transcription factor [Paenibacillus septentrionalis]|uniref:Response regulator transcription factor n=1 Tax=Paenibacillus septentrionalis TaxID=429342 RepID=A0ABW1V0N1_9BACL
MKRTLLLVEDDVHLREIIHDYFAADHWEVVEADNGVAALEAFDHQSFDLLILDIMMPLLDGFSVCRSIRKRSDIPIIMITAREADEDQVHGYELGADEYVTKPLSPKVLVARANALIKRVEGTVGAEDDRLNFGLLSIQLQSHQVKVQEDEIHLSPKEYELLVYLAKHHGKVLSRERLLTAVWGFDYEGDDRTVDTHVKKLRAKLGSEGHLIKTVIRTGYKFDSRC